MPAPTDTPTPQLEKLYRAATNLVRLLPDFLIIGTQRGGTTSLYNYLTEHPAIGSASIKEVHFFDSHHFEQGTAWYRAHFPSALQKYYVERALKSEFITGEATPYYLFHPYAAKRAASLLPKVKLIVMLRNPVDRAYSHYYHEIAGGHEHLPSFDEAIDNEEERLAGECEKMQANERYISYNHRHFSYLSRGLYVDQLTAWMSLFPKDQFLILQTEDFYANPTAIYEQTLNFLHIPGDLPAAQKQTFQKYNSTTPPRMDTATRKRLLAYFEPYNARLYAFLGKNFVWDA